MLEYINDPNDIKRIQPEDYKLLAKDIRRFLLKNVSRTGGHLASNLGIVELTMALHLVLDFPKDQLIFDVGHQSYVHKILTGRKDGFQNLRQFHGMSGFPKRKESNCDAFHSGHSSMSLSAALGMVTARDINHTDETIVAVIGDGALSGGMAYEALNNMARLRKEKKNLMVILNDNKMSIAENVGGMSAYLNKVRTKKEYVEFKGNVEQSLMKIPGIGRELTTIIKKSKDLIKQLFVPGMYFEDMGITYVGPIDGHNIPLMVDTLNRAKQLDEPIIIHVVTKKGKGYRPAEQNPAKFHGISPFSLKTGEVLKKSDNPSNTAVFSQTLIEEAKKDKTIVAVTAAMPDGTGLGKFKEHFPDRFFDVGIAEQHAVTFCAGMASRGLKPVFAVYSTFLQRGFDQVLHDVAIGNYPVIFGIDRSGLVGADGETHQGNFDISYLGMMPGMTVMAPKNDWELKEMLRFAVKAEGPVAIRYPRGNACQKFEEYQTPVEAGKSEVLHKGRNVAVLALGSMVEVCQEICEELEKDGIDPTFVNVRFVKPMDTALLDELTEDHSLLVTVEENVENGGFGQHVCGYMETHHPGCQVLPIAIPDRFVAHGSVDSLREQLGLCTSAIVKKIKNCGKE